jgi:hypothetical protein
MKIPLTPSGIENVTFRLSSELSAKMNTQDDSCVLIINVGDDFLCIRDKKFHINTGLILNCYGIKMALNFKKCYVFFKRIEKNNEQSHYPINLTSKFNITKETS